jgi:hypothetical protein
MTRIDQGAPLTPSLSRRERGMSEASLRDATEP